MTAKKITLSLNKIKSCKEQGFLFEALIRSYYLNIDLIKYILSSAGKTGPANDKKIKHIIAGFLEEISVNTELKSIINKRNLKSVKPWLNKMDVFFKEMKQGQAKNIKELQVETEKIFALLNISTSKLFVKNKK